MWSAGAWKPGRPAVPDPAEPLTHAVTQGDVANPRGLAIHPAGKFGKMGDGTENHLWRSCSP